MSSRPKLPSRQRQRRARTEPSEGAVHASDIVRLRQQLLSHPGFQEFARQPDKLAAIIQSDSVLQQAAATSPELAHLLNPATMQQALEMLVQPDADLATAAAPQMHCRALMQLQNYAVQLQQARASGSCAQQPGMGSDGLSDNHSRSATAVEARDAAPVKPADQQQHMWALVQQRFNKLQQRSQMIGPARLHAMQQQQQYHPAAMWPAGLQPLIHQQQPRVLETLVESPMAAGTPVAAVQAQRTIKREAEPAEGPAVTAIDAASTNSSDSSASKVCDPRCPRVSDGTCTMQELLAAFPDMLGGPPVDSPLWGSHGTIGLLSAVDHQPISSALRPAAAAAAADGDLAPCGAEVSPQQQQHQQHMLSSEVSTALPLSPHWQPPQQQQQYQSGPLSSCSSNPSAAKMHSSKSAGPLSSSDPTVSAAAVVPCISDKSSSSSSMLPAALPAAPLRPASALGHRILRPHSSSSVPLGSGSTPLGIAQLGSGELIVDITPPTRITTELSWSIDPEAAYILDASTSGSLVGQPSAAASTAAAAGNEWPAGVMAPGSSSGSLGAHSSGHLSSLFGVVVSTDPQSVDPPVPSSTAAKSSIPRPAPRAAGTRSGTKSAASRVSSSSSGRSSNSSTSRERGSRQQTGAATATAATTTAAAAAAKSAALVGPAAAAAVGAIQQQEQHCVGHKDGRHQQHQQQQHGSLPAVNSSSSRNQQPQPLPVSYLPHMTFQTAADPFTPGGVGHTGVAMHQSQQQHGSGRAISGPSMVNRSSYYEDVTPSMWKPGDGMDGTGDYLDLYRRAYCSYADAFFPPMWLSLIGILGSSHLLSFWQLLLVGALTFWPGLYVMAVRWAGVPRQQLSLSRVAPMMVVSLEVLCWGVSVLHILPAMWLGHATQCVVLLVLSVTMLTSHLMAFMQDPGYIPLLDEEEGSYPRGVSAHCSTTGSTGSPIGGYHRSSNGSISAAFQQLSGADLPSLQQSGHNSSSTSRLITAAANGCAHAAGKPQQGLQQQQQGYSGTPMLAGKSLTGCWTCGVEKNLRSKHCPICKRCVERFDHHCPVIGNCVGAKNHRTFVTYLMTLVICQLLFVQLLGGMLVTQHVTQHRYTHSVVNSVPQWISQHAGARVSVGKKLRAQVNHRVLLLLSLPAAAAEADQIRSDLAVDSSMSQNSAATSTTAAKVERSKVPDSSIQFSSEGAASTKESGSDSVSSAVTSNASDRELTSDAAAAANADYSANIVLTSTTAEGIDGHESSTIGTHMQQLPNSEAATAVAPLSRTRQTGQGAEAGSSTPASADVAAAAAGTTSSSSSSRAADVELLLARGSWSWHGCWLLLQALYAAAESSPGSLLLLLSQAPALFLSCSLLLRALFLAATNLTVNEWLNRHRYLYLQHTGAGFCNRFDRGPAHNCWEFWCGPAVVDWWQIWQQADEELKLKQQSVLTPHSATFLVRFWDVRWAKYQQKLTVARERRRERQLQRRMVALGLADNTIYE